MEIIIIFLLVAIITLFYKLKPSDREERNTENRQVSVDTHAETGTDKLLRRLDERENAEHNAELKTHDEHIK